MHSERKNDVMCFGIISTIHGEDRYAYVCDETLAEKLASQSNIRTPWPALIANYRNPLSLPI